MLKVAYQNKSVKHINESTASPEYIYQIWNTSLISNDW